MSANFERAMDKLTTEQLNESVSDEKDEVVAEPSAESVPEKAAEETVEIEPKAEEPAKEPEAEEEKVPKSRFLTMHQRAVEAEKALRQFEAERVNSPEQNKPAIADDEELKSFYYKLVGDPVIAEAFYQNELARLTAIEEKAAERAFERFSNKDKEQEKIVAERVASFDRAFEELGVVEGKEFSDDEQVAMLDIVENYSPKDKDGQLIGDFLLPLDKAYEIYKLNSEPKLNAKKAERNAVAALSGTRSEGAASGTDSDANFKPWSGSWRDKLPK